MIEFGIEGSDNLDKVTDEYNMNYDELGFRVGHIDDIFRLLEKYNIEAKKDIPIELKSLLSI